jgi:hypothetical protein
MITSAKVAILRAVIILLIPVSPLLHFAEITFLSLKSGKNRTPVSQLSWR